MPLSNAAVCYYRIIGHCVTQPTPARGHRRWGQWDDGGRIAATNQRAAEGRMLSVKIGGDPGAKSHRATRRSLQTVLWFNHRGNERQVGAREHHSAASVLANKEVVAADTFLDGVEHTAPVAQFLFYSKNVANQNPRNVGHASYIGLSKHRRQRR